MKRVLIAEDNEDLRQIFSTVFRRHKFEVRVAVNGLDALDKLKAEVPDALILDINMPELSGLEVLKRVRMTPELAHLKIIVVTGNYLADQAPEAQLADLFLVKPVSINELTVMAQRLTS